MGDDDVDDVGDDVLSCPGSYYCFSPTLLPTRRELKLNCSRSHQSSVLERSYSDIVVLCQNVLVGPMMGDDGVDDVGHDVLSCPGRYYCFSPTLLPTRRELKLNCSRSHPVVCPREIIF